MKTNIADNPLADWPVADYRESPVPELRGNIFAEALPHPRTYESWEKILVQYPPFSPEERALPAHARALRVRRLRNYFEPLERHCAFALDVATLLLWSYEGRDPNAPPFIEQLQRSYDEIQKGKDVPLITRSERPIEALLLLGPSGSGKTVTLQKVLSQYPQRLWHPKHGRCQIVWMSIDFPVRVGATEMALALYEGLAALAPPGAMPPLSRSERNVHSALKLFAHYALQFGLGLIVIEEAQNITPQSSGGSEVVINTTQALANLVRIPFIFTGTLKAMDVLGIDVRSVRRVSASGDYVWERLMFDTRGVTAKELPKNSEFVFLLQGLVEMQLIRHPAVLDRELAQAFYDETQGIVALLVTLFMLVQLEAIRNGSETMKAEFVRDVAAKRMKLVKRLVDAYRRNDQAAVAQFERDMSARKLHQWMSGTVGKATTRVAPDVPSRERRAGGELSLAQQQAVDFLRGAHGFTQADAVEAVKALGDDTADLEPPEICRQVLAAMRRDPARTTGAETVPTHPSQQPGDWRQATEGLEGEAALSALDRLHARRQV
jgi:AAA domain